MSDDKEETIEEFWARIDMIAKYQREIYNNILRTNGDRSGNGYWSSDTSMSQRKIYLKD